MTTDNPNDIIERVRAWQNNGLFHPLTCGNDSTHAKLEALEVDGKVVLVCPTCDYQQESIPHIVLGIRTPGAIKWP